MQQRSSLCDELFCCILFLSALQILLLHAKMANNKMASSSSSSSSSSKRSSWLGAPRSAFRKLLLRIPAVKRAEEAKRREEQEAARLDAELKNLRLKEEQDAMDMQEAWIAHLEHQTEMSMIEVESLLERKKLRVEKATRMAARMRSLTEQAKQIAMEGNEAVKEGRKEVERAKAARKKREEQEMEDEKMIKEMKEAKRLREEREDANVKFCIFFYASLFFFQFYLFFCCSNAFVSFLFSFILSLPVGFFCSHFTSKGAPFGLYPPSMISINPDLQLLIIVSPFLVFFLLLALCSSFLCSFLTFVFYMTILITTYGVCLYRFMKREGVI